jgi:tetratricopeptide (TPR) repeat protein
MQPNLNWLNFINDKTRVLTVIIIFTLCIYWNNLQNSFVWNDRFYIEEKGAVIESVKDLPSIFFKGFSTLKSSSAIDLYYRPITTLSYSLSYKLYGLRPGLWHLENILWHALNCCLTFILMSLLCGSSIAFLTALLFAAHPIHTANVDCIVNRLDMICLAFILIGVIKFIYYAKTKRKSLAAIGLVSFLCALLTKETAIIFPILILIIYPCIQNKKTDKKDLLAYSLFCGLTATFYFALRSHALTSQATSPIPIKGWPLFFTMTNVFFDYILNMLWPLKIRATDAFLLTKNILQNWTWAALISLASIITTTILWRKQKPLIFLSILWFFIALMPVSNIIPMLYLRSDHFLYIPSVGFSLFTAIALSNLHKKINKPYISAFVITLIIIFYSLLTINRNSDYRNDFTLFSRTVKKYPYAKEAHSWLAMSYHENNQLDEALLHYQMALNNYHGYYGFVSIGRIFEQIGGIYMAKQNYILAQGYYQVAIKINPNDYLLHYNLGCAFYGSGESALAAEEYRKSLKLNPNFDNAQYNLNLLK